MHEQGPMPGDLQPLSEVSRQHVAAAVIAVMCVSLVVGLVVHAYVDPSEQGDETRLKVAEIAVTTAAGAFVAIGVIVGWLSYQVGQKQLAVARDGQITDRYTRAIDQLGAIANDGTPAREIRLGGIYALDRIARDSPRDSKVVMDVLAAYVRRSSALGLHLFTPPAIAGGLFQLEEDVEAILGIFGREDV